MEDLRSGGPEARDRIDFRQLLSLGRADHPVADRVRAEQFAGIARMTPFMLACTLLFLSGLGTLLWWAGQQHWVWWWTAAQLAALAVNLFVVWRATRSGCPGAGAGLCMRATAAAAGLQALLFNIAMAVAAPQLDPATRSFVMASHLALSGAGAFCFAAAPLAGLVHVAVYCVGLLMLNASSPYPPFLVNALGLAYMAVLARGIVLHALTVARQVRARAALEDRGEVIAMLLNEYERHASDWLWESDPDHRLIRASQRLSDVLGLPLDRLLGLPIVRSAGSAGLDDVATAMRERRPFRSVQVRVDTPQGEKWLSLSGTPRFAPSGQFLGYRGVGSDITDARQSHEQITRMATCDGLTGLANRATLRGSIQAALREADRSRRKCALMLIDLDRFKAVNDTLGHPVGDELLREVARRLQREVGGAGEPARLGGDEFAAVLPPAAASDATTLAERIIAALSAPYQVRGHQLSVGASVGIAFGPSDAATVDDLLRAADLALYRAKADGRGVARIYAPQLRADAEERSLIESGLRAALRDGGFHLVFQPIIDLAQEEIRGFEALLRWTHPTLGPVPPLKFLPVAEEAGLIDAIGEWVIIQACHWVARWPEEVGVAVNLSPRQLANPDLPGIVLRALAEHGVAPDRLELEITENVFLNETAATRVALAQLRAIGVRIGLDDFGTGYSSLGYLRHAMFNTIKIDRSFVRDSVEADSHSAEIVRHIVSLAASLGMETVAEGAETGEELEAVRKLGCRRVQGFYTGRPMAPDEATALVLAETGPVRQARAA